MSWKAVDQDMAIAIDQHLMGPDVGYSVDQLMELAGLAVADVVARCSTPKTRIGVLVGPGNNGGDGLVAARHLIQFGFDVDVYSPKAPRNELMKRLELQLLNHGIEVLRELPSSAETLDQYEALVDSLFGFSFKGDPREPFATFLKLLTNKSYKTFAVDIPSGWNVNEGPLAPEYCYMPTHLISLTVPKLCSKRFNGSHWLGGRFVPRSTAEKFQIQVPSFPGAQLVMELEGESL
eukprot:Protomagalhaensia_sp_Gyna_25__2042@NODE_209_length_4399_cov_52_558257_g163_i0_p4_GENE_NODE_209_length_4399_cov_52_558257_g163_i0NODE_209_length_4399_cov_52_558257_g163_i0_p4_ORF_typecomplete_len235_score45_07YjeF_N/PF03853_15/1_1e44_NODE_209_length_4399_cov_52_558257_g163_i05071211